MAKAKLNLDYKQIIDKHNSDIFGIGVFNESYYEFLIQAAAFNRDNLFSTFEEITDNNPQAHSIHQKIGLKIKRYINSLQNVIPELHDTLDYTAIHFENYQFTLLNSQINNKDSHKIAITYFSNPLILLDTLGDYMVLAEEYYLQSSRVETFVLKMQPMLSIYNYVSLPNESGDDPHPHPFTDVSPMKRFLGH